MHAAPMSTRRHDTKVMSMRAMVTAFLLGALFGAFAISSSPPSSAQSAVGGATKAKQNAIGGAAKPGPMIGGSTAPASVVGGTTKPGSAGIATNSTGNTAKQNPPGTPPNKGGTVVTTPANLKCGAGACVTRGTKP